MPRYSRRAQLLNYYRRLLTRRIRFGTIRERAGIYDSDEESFDEFVALSLLDIHRRRYIVPRDTYKESNWHDVLNNLDQLTESQFLLLYRICRESFDLLYDLIKDHHVFKRKMGPHGNLLKVQYPIRLQLLVFLYSLGCSGSDCNNKRIAARFHVSSGVIHLFVQRVTKALLSHKNDVIRWPSEDEKLNISNEIKQQYGLPNCIGIMDGTLLRLQYAPLIHPENYHSRKGFYAVQALIICDHTCRINHVYVGWPGSTHDNRVWRNSKVFQYQDLYFNDIQYVICDSAYTVDAHVIPAYKRSRGIVVLDAMKMFFNRELSICRVKVEHTIGLLKNRFLCLKDLNILISDKKSMKVLIDRFLCCVILHNLLLHEPIPDEWHNYDEEDDEELDLGENSPLMQPALQCNIRREQLRTFVVEQAGCI